MSNGHYEELKRILNGDDEIPQRVSNRLLFSVVMEVLNETKEIRTQVATETQKLQESLDNLIERVDQHDLDIDQLKRHDQEHPSLLWLLRYRTQDTAKIIITVFALLLIIFTITPFGQALLSVVTGIPLP